MGKTLPSNGINSRSGGRGGGGGRRGRKSQREKERQKAKSGLRRNQPVKELELSKTQAFYLTDSIVLTNPSDSTEELCKQTTPHKHSRSASQTQCWKQNCRLESLSVMPLLFSFSLYSLNSLPFQSLQQMNGYHTQPLCAPRKPHTHSENI